MIGTPSSLSIDIIDDLIYEGDHDFELVVSEAEDRVTIAASATVTILENEGKAVKSALSQC